MTEERERHVNDIREHLREATSMIAASEAREMIDPLVKVEAHIALAQAKALALIAESLTMPPLLKLPTQKGSDLEVRIEPPTGLHRLLTRGNLEVSEDTGPWIKAKPELAAIISMLRVGDRVSATFIGKGATRTVTGMVHLRMEQWCVDDEPIALTDGTPVSGLEVLEVHPRREPGDRPEPMTGRMLGRVVGSLREGDEVSVFLSPPPHWRHGLVTMDEADVVWLGGVPLGSRFGSPGNEDVKAIYVTSRAADSSGPWQEVEPQDYGQAEMRAQEQLRQTIASLHEGDLIEAGLIEFGARGLIGRANRVVGQWYLDDVLIASADGIPAPRLRTLKVISAAEEKAPEDVNVQTAEVDAEEAEGRWVRGDIAGAGSEIVFEHPDGRLTRDDSGHVEVPRGYFKQVTPVDVTRRQQRPAQSPGSLAEGARVVISIPREIRTDYAAMANWLNSVSWRREATILRGQRPDAQAAALLCDAMAKALETGRG